MKNFRAVLALLVICVFVFGCKLTTNTNNDNNSNNSNRIDISNKNDNGNGNKSNKNDNKDDGGDVGKPDVSKIPIPTKKPSEKMPDEGGGNSVSHTGAGVAFTIPQGWNGKDGGDRYIVAAPDDRLEVFFYVPADGNFDNGVNTVVAEMKQYLGNMQVTEQAKKTSVNGMQAVSEAGTGTYDGTQIVWVLMAIKSPKDPLFVVTVCDPKDFEGNKAGYQALIGSIKPN